MNEVFRHICLQAEKILSAEELDLLKNTFTLIKCDGNLFVFGYRDKAAYNEFLAKNKNALRSACGEVCGQMPDIRFRFLKKKRESEDKREKNYKKGIKNVVASLICLVLAFVLGVISVNYMANRNFKEDFYSVSIARTAENFRVIQLSDLHNCSYGTDNKNLLDRITKLRPDIIVLTGDCLDENGDVEQIVRFCRALREIAPVYYIYGNNECRRAFSSVMTLESLDSLIDATDENRDVKKLYALDNGLKATLESSGVKVLFNESDSITVGENKIRIFGTLTSNPSAFWQYAGAEFSKFITENSDEIKLFLCHEPLLIETIKEPYWGDLVLSGDTHGGEARIPGLGAVYSRSFGFFPERSKHMIYGKYTSGDSQVIVSSGLENKNPLRIFNQPEIAIIDINKY